MTPFLAVDWGGSNVRAWMVDGAGDVLAERFTNEGVLRLQPGEAEQVFARVRLELGAADHPALLCGSVGSNRGWRAVPYVSCPVSLPMLAQRLTRLPLAGAPVLVVGGVEGPGLEGAADVMRGEETQVFGWLALDESARRGRRLVCHPGTHTKWITLEDGAITGVMTFMTGELYELLRTRSILSPSTAEADPLADLDAFDEGVRRAGDGGALACRLFAARTRIVRDDADPRSTAAFLSGLLVAADVAAALAVLAPPSGDEVILIGARNLRRVYARVLGARGMLVREVSGEAAALAGLKAVFAAAVPC